MKDDDYSPSHLHNIDYIQEYEIKYWVPDRNTVEWLSTQILLVFNLNLILNKIECVVCLKHEAWSVDLVVCVWVIIAVLCSLSQAWSMSSWFSRVCPGHNCSCYILVGVCMVRFGAVPDINRNQTVKYGSVRLIIIINRNHTN